MASRIARRRTREFESSSTVLAILLVEQFDARPFHHHGWRHPRLVEDFGPCEPLGTIRYPGGTHAS
jgi:hypothetical protein